MMTWDLFKKGFDAWESATATYLEQVMQSPLVLGPSGAMLTAALKAKAQGDKALATYWSTLGLPTRRDQERMLHAVNQLHSRIADLEEQLEAARKAQNG